MIKSPISQPQLTGRGSWMFKAYGVIEWIRYTEYNGFIWQWYPGTVISQSQQGVNTCECWDWPHLIHFDRSLLCLGDQKCWPSRTIINCCPQYSCTLTSRESFWLFLEYYKYSVNHWMLLNVNASIHSWMLTFFIWTENQKKRKLHQKCSSNNRNTKYSSQTTISNYKLDETGIWRLFYLENKV